MKFSSVKLFLLAIVYFSLNSFFVPVCFGEQLDQPSYLYVPECSYDSYKKIVWGPSNVDGVTYVLERAWDAEFTSIVGPLYTGTGRYVSFSVGSGIWYFRIKATKPGYEDSTWLVADNPLNTQDACKQTELISIGVNGEMPDGGSSDPSISMDGNLVSFSSSATNLVANASNGYQQVFVYDRTTKISQVVSVSSNGALADNSCYGSSISPDGKYVAFYSMASNLVSNDTNGFNDIFVHELSTGITEKISIGLNGAQPNNHSSLPSISSDGRYVAFMSNATNLVAGDTNAARDIFVYDRVTKTTKRVSVGPDGVQANSYSGQTFITPDGRHVAFWSYANNLVPGISFSGGNVFVHDCVTGLTSIVSVANDGTPGDGYSSFPTLSADGRFVAFISGRSTNLVEGLTITEANHYVYLHDRDVDEDGIFDELAEPGSISTKLVSMRYTQDYYPNLSLDGGNVVFSHKIMNYPYSVKHYDVNTYESEYFHPDQYWPNADSYSLKISENGRFVVFSSAATNLINGDTNGLTDVFLNDSAKDEDGDGFDEYEDCRDDDLLINPGVPEIPYNGFDDNCNGISDDDDLDGDGYGIAVDCNDLDPAINPSIAEIAYNGIDENCNGMTDDDDLDHDDYGFATDCNDNDASIYPGAPETKHDGTDQDCNGYDLTIDITVADYNSKDTLLTVKGTSSWGASANLEVVGYGPMTWKDNQQVWIFDFIGSNPGTVTVTGFEGSETATVTVQ